MSVTSLDDGIKQSCPRSKGTLLLSPPKRRRRRQPKPESKMAKYQVLLSFLLVTIIALCIEDSNAMGVPSGSYYGRIGQPYVDVSMVRPIVYTSPNNRPETLTKGKTLLEAKAGRSPALSHGDLGRVLLKRQKAVLQDPRFQNCMGEADGPDDPKFMAVFAKCYSFAGRPRFGKRSWRNWELPKARFDV